MEPEILNPKEIEVLKACVNEVISCTGSEFGYTSDIKLEGFSKNQLKGYFSQLVQKKTICIYEDFDGQFNLTKLGCELAGVDPEKFQLSN